MNATATTTVRKSLRHSQLRAMGAVKVMVTAHPRTSKFAGRGSFACLTVEGHVGISYALACENENVAAELRALPLNTSVEVVAMGRDDAATIQRTGTPTPVVAPVAVAPYGVMDAVDAALMLVDALRTRLHREPTPAEASAAAAIWTARTA